MPKENLDAIADAGLYGVVGRAEDGGLDADPATFYAVTEALAGGCLATAFIWSQHHSAVRALSASSGALRARWLARLCRGEVRAGIALAGLAANNPGIRATRISGGWRLDGTAPWVTGWGRIDQLLIAGVDDAANVVSVLVPARSAPGLVVGDMLDLVAVRASATSSMRLDGFRITDDDVATIEPLADRLSREPLTLRMHGALVLGVAERCIRLIGDAPLRRKLDETRRRLLESAADDMPAAKAATSALAMRAASSLVVATGSRSLLRSEHAQRLVREALFLLVFGSRPAIKAALLSTL